MFKGYAAKEVDQKLENFEINPEKLGPYNIGEAITHCGICLSDLHLIDNDWQISQYPLLPGHEIIGTATTAEPMITHLKTGQRSISGSPIGSRSVINEMLQFAARHNIVAKTEVLPLADVNTTIEKVRDNKARYRMVLFN